MYTIYIRSNKHPRTINTPTNGRVYYEAIRVNGREALTEKVAQLREDGEFISEICTNLGTRIYM